MLRNGLSKTTFKNLDSFFNALSSLVGLIFSGKANEFITALSVSYQRIQTLLITDPIVLIRELKSAHKLYFEWIRGGPNPIPNMDDIDPDTLSDSLAGSPFGSISTASSLLLAFVRLRTILYGELSSTDRLTFDRLVLGFFNLHRLIITPVNFDYSTITNPAPKEESTPEVEPSTPPVGKTTGKKAAAADSVSLTDSEIRTALLRLGITPVSFSAKLKEFSRSQDHEIFSTAGPNGAATWSAYADAVAILANSVLTQNLSVWAEKTGLYRFWSNLLGTVRLNQHDPMLRSTPILGKIYSFAEWGGKSRHVAILDYWTQLFLTPLHKTIFHFLEQIPMDATFNQDAAADTIRQWTASKTAQLNSVDLTAATDRLPLTLQEQVLSILLSDKALGKAWGRILVERDFEIHDGSTIRYAVGQPMGARSSWAMLALCHHIIIQVCSIRSNYNLTSEVLLGQPAPSASSGSSTSICPYTAYRVCGDDSTFAGTPILTQYKLIMAHLGVSISEFKSVLWGGTLSTAAEFCKRLFISGVEYSSISPKLVIKTIQNGRLGPTLQNDLVKRGLNFPGTTLMAWLAALLDQESLDFLIIMNLLPTSLTGLIRKASLPASTPALETLFGSSSPVTESDFVQAYTYVAVVGQLKRLDALLQQTTSIAELIEDSTVGALRPSVPTIDASTVPGFATILSKLHEISGETSLSHPIVLAATAEASRVTSLLSQLATGVTDLGTAARLRMLDMFRNALSSAWQDPEAARAQADRSLIQGALTILGQLVAKRSEHEFNPRLYGPPIASFTTLLAHVRRLWSVNWQLGQVLRINTVKSNVTASASTASTRLETASKAVGIVSRFRVTPRVQDPS